MKLLFKDDGFARDYKDLLGFVDADMNYKNLQPGLKSATRGLIKLIGSDLYDEIVNIFEDEEDERYDDQSLSPEEKESKLMADHHLLEYVRYPIAINAYRTYAPTNDLKHSNNGRMMRFDDNQKSPFQWMIDKDDKNLEILYYRSLDDLLEYLEDDNPYDWTSSEPYKTTKKNFITTTTEFDEFFPIQSRLLLIKLMPAFPKIERDHLIPILGKDRVNELKTFYQNNFKDESLSEDEKIKNRDIINLIQGASVCYALAWGLKRLSVQLFPEGVLLHYVSDDILSSKNITHYNEAQLAQQEFTKDYNRFLSYIQDAVKDDNLSDDGPLPHDFGFSSNDPFVIS